MFITNFEYTSCALSSVYNYEGGLVSGHIDPQTIEFRSYTLHSIGSLKCHAIVLSTGGKMAKDM